MTLSKILEIPIEAPTLGRKNSYNLRQEPNVVNFFTKPIRHAELAALIHQLLDQ